MEQFISKAMHFLTCNGLVDVGLIRFNLDRSAGVFICIVSLYVPSLVVRICSSSCIWRMALDTSIVVVMVGWFLEKLLCTIEVSMI